MTFPARSPEMIEQIRRAYARSLPARTIGLLFGLPNGEIYALVRRHGWAARSEMTPCERANQRGQPRPLAKSSSMAAPAASTTSGH
jgi:hypothetical protein